MWLLPLPSSRTAPPLHNRSFRRPTIAAGTIAGTARAITASTAHVGATEMASATALAIFAPTGGAGVGRASADVSGDAAADGGDPASRSRREARLPAFFRFLLVRSFAFD